MRRREHPAGFFFALADAARSLANGYHVPCMSEHGVSTSPNRSSRMPRLVSLLRPALRRAAALCHLGGSRRTAHVRLPSWWRRHPLLAALILVLVLLSYLDHRGYAGWRGDDRTRYHGGIFACTRVIDGDTIDVDSPDAGRGHTRIRLRGVDSPELARANHPDMHFGREAAAFAERALLHQPVRLELAPGPTRDRYGRLLAYVYRVDAGEMVNAAIIRNGYGYADDRFDDPRSGYFARLEAQARMDQRGLWKQVTSELMPAWRRQKAN